MAYKNQEQTCLSTNQISAASSILSLWIEDAIWSRAYVISTVENLPNLDATTERLLRVPTDFYNLLKTFWGEDFALQFLNYINERIAHERDLLIALIDKNQAAADKFTKELYANADRIATFFSQFARRDKHEWQKLLYKDIQMYISQITSILTSNYSSEISIFENIVSNAINMANYMAYGLLTRIFM